jgi:hypothetical protein
MKIKKSMLLIAGLALFLSISRNIRDHTTISQYDECASCILVWIDYGRVHITLGGTSGMRGWEFKTYWLPEKTWSWEYAGHLRMR